MFAPHPDDEVIGLGGQLAPRAPRVHVVYVSDGAPENPAFFRDLGFSERTEYARARRREALAALALAGIPPSAVHELGATDQAVARALPTLARRAARLLGDLVPDVVFVPPYEGGHPDHDGTALSIHAAVRLLQQEGKAAPVLLEYTSYHEREGTLVFGEFLPDAFTSTREITLDEDARSLKARMLACHATQTAVWRGLALERERVRTAARYDFRLPPRAPFHYDRMDWGMRGEEFLEHARRALAELGIDGPC